MIMMKICATLTKLFIQWLFLDFLLKWFGLKFSGWVFFPETDHVDFKLLSVSRIYANLMKTKILKLQSLQCLVISA